MAEDAASKTEEPTPHKLSEARKKGDVAKSQDVPALFSLFGAAAVLLVGGGWLSRDLVANLRVFVESPQAIDLAGGEGMAVLDQVVRSTTPMLVACLLAAALAGAAGNLVQHGLLFTTEKLKPDPKHVSPIQGFKRLFGPDAWVQFAKSLLKVLVLCAIAYGVLQPHLHTLQGLAALEPLAMLDVTADLLRRLFFAVLGVMTAVAAADWFWQRKRFTDRMKMSLQEVRDELKQQDGDPHIKAKLKQKRMEAGRRRMLQNVPKATVVVMNPTHYAVALRYEAGTDAAPLCVAKGVDAVALRIRAVAEEAGVAVVEDPPLARALFAAVDVDESIPRDQFEAVAKVIGFVLGARSRRAAAPAHA